MALSKVRKRGQCIAYISCTRSTFPLRSAGAARRLTWMRRITRTPSSVTTSRLRQQSIWRHQFGTLQRASKRAHHSTGS